MKCSTFLFLLGVQGVFESILFYLFVYDEHSVLIFEMVKPS